MKVFRVFESLQGEGHFSGVPTLFFRLCGCNLHCNWCDAGEALDPTKCTEMTVEDIVHQIHSSHLNDICITGGEPLLQEGELTQVLHDVIPQKRVSIETNGTLPIKNIRIAFPQAFFSVDWKTPSSGSTDFHEDNLQYIGTNGWIKFVVNDEADLLFAQSKFPLIEEHELNIHISPVFEKGSDWFSKVSSFLMKNCTEGNISMQLQLHKILDIE